MLRLLWAKLLCHICYVNIVNMDFPTHDRVALLKVDLRKIDLVWSTQHTQHGTKYSLTSEIQAEELGLTPLHVRIRSEKKLSILRNFEHCKRCELVRLLMRRTSNSATYQVHVVQKSSGYYNGVRSRRHLFSRESELPQIEKPDES